MNFRTTIVLLVAVVATGLYIQFGERNRESTDERRATARLALKFDPDRVSGLRIESGDGLFIITRTNGAWQLRSPVNAKADPTAVMRIIDTIADLRKSEIITRREIRDQNIDPRQYGFTAPRAVITLSDGPWQMSVLVGKDSPGAYQLYMKRADRDDIIVTDRDILDVLPASVLDVRDRHLFSGQPGNVQRIELQAGEGPWHASRDKLDQWIIDQPVHARGLSGAIRQWLDGLYEFRIHDFVADSVAAGSLYGFDEPLAQVAVFTDNRAVPQVLKIGRAADVGETAYYATIAGQEAVFAVSADMFAWLRQDTERFRDTRLLSMPAATIGYVAFTEGEQTLELERNTGDVWEVTSPKRFTAHAALVEEVLATWTMARADRFIDPPYGADEMAILDKAARQIRFARTRPAGTAVSTNVPSVQQYDGASFILAVGEDEDTVYAAPMDKARILVLPADCLTAFSVNPLDYRNPVVMAEDTYAIRRITQRDGDHENVVARTNAHFIATAPGHIAQDDAVETVLAQAARLVAARLVEEDAADLAPYGLDAASQSIVFGLSGSAGINRVLLFGDPASSDEHFATVQGTDLVFTVPTATVEIMMNPVALPIIAEDEPADAKP